MTTNDSTVSAAMTGADLKWDIALEISEDEATYLDRKQNHSLRSSEQDLSIPRDVIADVVKGSRIVAELARPIRLGTHNEQAAYLLQTHFSFQRVSSNNWLSRVRAAEITIDFEDAGSESDGTENNTTSQLHPAVAAWHPKLFEGEISQALITGSASVSLNAGYMGVGAEVGVEQGKTYVEKGRVVVHGVRGGGRSRNSITWVIEQDTVEKSGIPREITLPLIVSRANGRRFSACVTVKAHYGFWRGALARNVPVIGKNKEPVYFDPATLESIAKSGQRGNDGTIIAEQYGPFDQVDLVAWSSFPKMQ